MKVPSSASTSPSMIVFDKDGTLGNCTQSLYVWVERMADSIVTELIKNGMRNQSHKEHLLSIFYSAVGFDSANNKLVDSSECILSSGTWQQVLEVTISCIRDYIPNAHEKVTHWHETMGDIHAKDEPLVSNLEALMNCLKAQGFTIAICTSDDRKATNFCMKNWNIAHLVDVSVLQ
uniref:Uncharacterized protein n=1 Tax=Ditylum brightwellii TaxID=49249 RepID=A0A6S8XAR3_9STRA|mmetsp:Transcript_32846/g.43789  ORF Transcript_32846/g.43789 Transcript_32846/m.43789 type:complete len:176 (+) Transcript_32846:121-648(+)